MNTAKTEKLDQEIIEVYGMISNLKELLLNK
jgi:hypothetical protein